jgi:type II secretory pathway pseudopilin PulG
MFGLDARIALAIFGALSVISGAALYSAIKDARATSAVVELKEIGKAFEAYYLDTGQYPELISPGASTWGGWAFKSSSLIDDDGVKGWNGPYLPYKSYDVYAEHPKYGFVIIGYYENDVWYDFLGSGAWCDNVGEVCSIWVGFQNIKETGLAEDIDHKIDGTNINLPERNGDIRVKDHVVGGYNKMVLMKYMPTKNTN